MGAVWEQDVLDPEVFPPTQPTQQALSVVDGRFVLLDGDTR